MATYQKIKALPQTPKETQAINESRKIRGWIEAKKNAKGEVVEPAGYIKNLSELQGEQKVKAESLAKDIDRMASTRLVIDYLNRVRITNSNARLLISRRLGRYSLDDIQKMLTALEKEFNTLKELALSTPEVTQTGETAKEWTVESVLADVVDEEEETESPTV